jgi:intracellular septation protein
MALDYGPLVVFFAVNFLTPGLPIVRVLVATFAFMIATVVAVALSWLKTRHVSPMLWMTAALVLVFGGLTLYFHNPNFIKIKPTVIYGLFACILTFGLVTGRPLLQQLLGAAYPGLNAIGWAKLTRNFAIFFVFMAILNEAVWRTTAPLPTDNPALWVKFKLFGAIPLTILFSIANIPMLMRHGLTMGEPTPEELPPPQ